LVVRSIAAISDVDTRQILESHWTNHRRDKPTRARRARAMQEKIYENLRNPARARHAGAMRWFPTNIGIHQKRHKYTT
jgi:hypothetical protein